MASKQYRVKSAAGPWLAGDVVEAGEFEAHPFHEKFLSRGVAVPLAEGEKADKRSAELQGQINDLDVQIAELQSQRASLEAEQLGAAENVDFVLPEQGEEEGSVSPAEQQQIRKEGREVVQPLAGDAIAGEVVPADEAEKANAKRGAQK